MFKFTCKIKPAFWLESNMTSLRDFLNNCYFYKIDKNTYETTINGVIDAFNAKGLTVAVDPIGVDGVEVVFSVYYNGTYTFLAKIFAKAPENYVQRIYKSVQATDINIAVNFKMINTLQTINYSESELYKKLNSFFHEDDYSFKMQKLTNILNEFVDDSYTISVNEVTTSIIVEAYSATVHRKNVSIFVNVLSKDMNGGAVISLTLDDADSKVTFSDLTSL